MPDQDVIIVGFHRAVALVRHPAVAALAELVLAGQTPFGELEAPGALDDVGQVTGRRPGDQRRPGGPAEAR